jgi:hypothetical protein
LIGRWWLIRCARSGEFGGHVGQSKHRRSKPIASGELFHVMGVKLKNLWLGIHSGYVCCAAHKSVFTNGGGTQACASG